METMYKQAKSFWRIIPVVMTFLLSVVANAQQTVNVNLLATTTNKIPQMSLLKGEQFTINKVICDVSSARGFNYILDITKANGTPMTVDLSKVHQMPIRFEADSKDQFWYGRTIAYCLPFLAGMSNAYSLRNKAEIEANQYVSAIRDNALTIEDPYLSSYINSLLVKINPSQRLDSFKYNFKVIIVKDAVPNAGIYPNGALLVNAGMLARIHTEDELVALLCHEANHFICDHYLENMAKIQKREAISAIGSAIVGVTTGIITGSVSLGTSATSITSALATSLNKMITSMGLVFDQSQERESDQAAAELLPLLGYDQNAMATCLKAIGNFYLIEGNLAAYYKSGDHPKIEDRIAATGIPYERRDSTFDKRMAPCVSYVAQVKFSNGRYSEALDLVEQNISYGVGRGMDYYIKGECLLSIYDTEETNTQAVEALQRAHETYPADQSMLKSLIVAKVRTGDKATAKELINEFKGMIESSEKPSEEDKAWAEGMLMNINL